jgi:DnaK suppressor protein
MTPEEARRRLLAERDALRADAEASAHTRDAKETGATRLGQLSRMDALQQQSMARAEQQRRERALFRIEAALRRIEAGEYGDCTGCGEPVADARLRLDPSAALCIACAQRHEQAGQKGR